MLSQGNTDRMLNRQKLFLHTVGPYFILRGPNAMHHRMCPGYRKGARRAASVAPALDEVHRACNALRAHALRLRTVQR
jgi:hypothetical protein